MNSNINKIGLLTLIAGLLISGQPGSADELVVPDEVIVVPRTTVVQRPVIIQEVPVIKHKKRWFKRHRDRDRVSYRLPFVNVDKFDDDHVVIDAPFVHVEADD